MEVEKTSKAANATTETKQALRIIKRIHLDSMDATLKSNLSDLSDIFQIRKDLKEMFNLDENQEKIKAWFNVFLITRSPNESALEFYTRVRRPCVSAGELKGDVMSMVLLMRLSVEDDFKPFVMEQYRQVVELGQSLPTSVALLTQLCNLQKPLSHNRNT